MTVCQRTAGFLDCRPESVAAGRNFVARALMSWGVAEPDPASAALDDVLLIATELLNNAVHVGANPIALVVEAHRDHVHIGVRDDNPLPAALRNPDNGSEGGRGLAIVDALSDRWGQTPYDGTKWVWADVSIAPGSVLAQTCRL